MPIEGVSFNANITPSEIATNDQLEMDIRACLMTWIGIRRNLLRHDPKLEWYSIVSPPDDAEPDEEFLEDASIIDYMIKNPDYLMGVAMYVIHRMALRGNERGDGS